MSWRKVEWFGAVYGGVRTARPGQGTVVSLMHLQIEPKVWRERTIIRSGRAARDYICVTRQCVLDLITLWNFEASTNNGSVWTLNMFAEMAKDAFAVDMATRRTRLQAAWDERKRRRATEGRR